MLETIDGLADQEALRAEKRLVDEVDAAGKGLRRICRKVERAIRRRLRSGVADRWRALRASARSAWAVRLPWRPLRRRAPAAAPQAGGRPWDVAAWAAASRAPQRPVRAGAASRRSTPATAGFRARSRCSVGQNDSAACSAIDSDERDDETRPRRVLPDAANRRDGREPVAPAIDRSGVRRRDGRRGRGWSHESGAGTSSAAEGTRSCLTCTRLPSMTSRPAQNARTAAGSSRCSICEHARGERSLVVAVVHGNRALRDDRPVVECRGHEMHGAPVNAHAVRQRAAMRVEPRIRGAGAMDEC